MREFHFTDIPDRQYPVPLPGIIDSN